ncbi:hypothetical protein F5Y18DRAFT_10643, partial [Xylariaceae sp. FL1019]
LPLHYSRLTLLLFLPFPQLTCPCADFNWNLSTLTKACVVRRTSSVNSSRLRHSSQFLKQPFSGKANKPLRPTPSIRTVAHESNRAMKANCVLHRRCIQSIRRKAKNTTHWQQTRLIEALLAKSSHCVDGSRIML